MSTQREWEPGDRAYIEVEFVARNTPFDWVSVGLPGGGMGKVQPSSALRPVPAAGEAATEDVIEQAAEVMHDAYEDAAKAEGWETQERSRKPWSDVPEANKATMRAAVRAVVTSGLLAGDVPGRSEAEGAAVYSSHTIKTIGEALSYAECALLNFYRDNGQRAMYARVIADLLADIERQRPTGPDGKHGDRHTPTCGCADRIGGE